MKQLDPSVLDGPADRVRRSHAEAIKELQALPATSTQIINDVVLADATVTVVAHALGRRPKMLIVSPPRGAMAIGIIEEKVLATENPDRTKFVALKASGMGGTIIVDIEVK